MTTRSAGRPDTETQACHSLAEQRPGVRAPASQRDLGAVGGLLGSAWPAACLRRLCNIPEPLSPGPLAGEEGNVLNDIC